MATSPIIDELLPPSLDPRTRLILDAIISRLRQEGIEPISAAASITTVVQADPNAHDIVHTEDTPPNRDDLAGTVKSVVRPGFRTAERVLRQPAVTAYRRRQLPYPPLQ